jgi:hypothetical protein
MRRSNPCFLSVARVDRAKADATKQSILSFCREMDCFAGTGALRATRWLAMTVEQAPCFLLVIARSTCDEAIHSFFPLQDGLLPFLCKMDCFLSFARWIASLRSQ